MTPLHHDQDYLNQECKYPIQTNTHNFKVFSSGFKSANLKAYSGYSWKENQRLNC